MILSLYLLNKVSAVSESYFFLLAYLWPFQNAHTLWEISYFQNVIILCGKGSLCAKYYETCHIYYIRKVMWVWLNLQDLTSQVFLYPPIVLHAFYTSPHCQCATITFSHKLVNFKHNLQIFYHGNQPPIPLRYCESAEHQHLCSIVISVTALCLFTDKTVCE